MKHFVAISIAGRGPNCQAMKVLPRMRPAERTGLLISSASWQNAQGSRDSKMQERQGRAAFLSGARYRIEPLFQLMQATSGSGIIHILSKVWRNTIRHRN